MTSLDEERQGRVEIVQEARPSPGRLFLTFLRLGLTAFGGPSMIAYIRRVTVDQKGWLDAESFNDGVAMCQMIPGATAMQATAYVGLKNAGWGARRPPLSASGCRPFS